MILPHRKPFGERWPLNPKPVRLPCVFLGVGVSFLQLKLLHGSTGTTSQRLQQLQNRQTEIANVASAWRCCDQRTVRPLQSIAGGTSINDAPLGELAQRCKRWGEQTESFDQWVSFAGWRKDVDEVGLGTVVGELIAVRFTPDQTRK